jgi:3-oxoadipate enol-lactonase
MANVSELLTLPDGRLMRYALSSTAYKGPLVLLVNSLCSPLGSWDKVVEALESKGFRTLRYNQPGHDGSSAPRNLENTTFESLADDVRYLLQSLKISRLYAWIGVSMGAACSIVFAARYPGIIQNLIICDTISSSAVNVGLADPFGPRVQAARVSGNMELTTRQTMERWFGKEWMDANPTEAQRMRTLMNTTTVDGFETCCYALRSKSFDLRPVCSQVGAGVENAVLVVGEKDANLPQTMADMRDIIQESFHSLGKRKSIELKVIKNAGHVCYIDGFEDFLHVVFSFFQQNSA